MRIPKKFKIKGKTWKVIYEYPLIEGGMKCSGLCDTNKRIIYLDSELKRKQRTSVFLHELYHALIFEAHINPGVRFSEGLEEVLADAFADLLTTTFQTLKWKNKGKK